MLSANFRRAKKVWFSLFCVKIPNAGPDWAHLSGCEPGSASLHYEALGRPDFAVVWEGRKSSWAERLAFCQSGTSCRTGNETRLI